MGNSSFMSSPDTGRLAARKASEAGLPRICEVVAGLALLLLWGAPAQAQDQVVDERLDASMSAPLHNPHFDILVVTVVAIENGAFTSENPPQGLVRVDDSLRGDETAGTIYPARWSGPLRADDYEGHGGGRHGPRSPPRVHPGFGQR